MRLRSLGGDWSQRESDEGTRRANSPQGALYRRLEFLPAGGYGLARKFLGCIDRASGRTKMAGLEQIVVRAPPRPPRQGPAPVQPEIGPEPFDPVVDTPFFDLALRLAKRARFSLSPTARTAEPTTSAPGKPGAPQSRSDLVGSAGALICAGWSEGEHQEHSWRTCLEMGGLPKQTMATASLATEICSHGKACGGGAARVSVWDRRGDASVLRRGRW